MLSKNLQKIILFFLLFLWQQMLLAAPLEILGVRVNKVADGSVNCDFTLNKSPLYRTFSLNDSPRIVIDFDNAIMLSHVNRAEFVDTPVKNIRTGKHENNLLRVVIDTSNNVGFHIMVIKDKKAGKAHLIVSLAKRSGTAKINENNQNNKHTNTTSIASLKKMRVAKKVVAKNTVKKKSSQIFLPAALNGKIIKAKPHNVNKENVASITQNDINPANVASAHHTIVATSMSAVATEVAKAKINPVAIIPIPIPPLNSTPKTASKSAVLNKGAPPSIAVKPTVVMLPQPHNKTPLVSQSEVQKQNMQGIVLPVTKQAAAVAHSPPPLDPKNSVALLEPDSKQKPRDIIVVIDPGHGGKDPGAHGTGGTKEKDVVLVAAKNLQNYLNNQNGYSAILTRDGDYYINLRERLRIAHVNKADIFLSLHADAYKNILIKGSSLFALSQSGATSEAARWLAERENISELDGSSSKSGNALRSILLDLAQNASIKTSLLAGDAILSSLSTVVKMHTKRLEQADFVVLQSPDIPSLLVETGFISDPADEQKLKDPLFQELLARALANGIMNYFAQHPPRGTLIGANSQRQQLYSVRTSS